MVTKLSIYGVIIALMMSFSLGSMYEQSSPNWEILRKGWEDYLSYPSSENATKMAFLLPDKPIGHDKTGSMVIQYIFDTIGIVEYGIFLSDKSAVKLAYRLINISDGAYTELLLLDLSSLVRINPKLFLEELKSHRHSDAVRRLGLIAFADSFFSFAEPSADKLERQLKIQELETVKAPELIAIRDECLAVLKSRDYSNTKKKKN
jgi:hypothetical protein